MKIRLITPVFIVLLCIPFSSCDKIKKLADVSFDVYYSIVVCYKRNRCE